MLYVYAIQKRHADPETYLPAFHAAVKCQKQITSIAVPGSLAQRYGVVLQELRLEVLRHNSQLLALAGEDIGTDEAGAMRENGNDGLLGSFSNQGPVDMNSQGMHFAPTASEEVAGHLNLGREDGPLGFGEHSPGSSIEQMMGWGQFDSLVSGMSEGNVGRTVLTIDSS
jgi:hypothetical protein